MIDLIIKLVNKSLIESKWNNKRAIQHNLCILGIGIEASTA